MVNAPGPDQQLPTPDQLAVAPKSTEQVPKTITGRAKEMVGRLAWWRGQNPPDPDAALQALAAEPLQEPEQTTPEMTGEQDDSQVQSLSAKTEEEINQEIRERADRLPSIEDFPEKARAIESKWITQITQARLADEGLDPNLLKEIQEIVTQKDFGKSPLHVWGSRALYLAAKGPMYDNNGHLLKTIDLGYSEHLLADFGTPEAKQIEKGEDVVVHSTDRSTLLDILQQNELSCRDKQIKPRFNTGGLKAVDREKYDVSFAWNSHIGRYGKFALIIPTDLALQNAAFCEIDGMHVVNKNYAEGYTYNLDQPFAVVAEQLDSFGGSVETHTNFLNTFLRWSSERKREWYESHSSPKIMDENQTRENELKLGINLALIYSGWTQEQADQWVETNFRSEEGLSAVQAEERQNQLQAILSLTQLKWSPEQARNWADQHLQNLENLDEKQKRELYAKLNFNLDLIKFGWPPEKADQWVEEHLVIGDQFDEKENTNLRGSTRLSNIYWDFSQEQISPLKQRILNKFKIQNYVPSQGKRFFPTGEQIDFGTNEKFWTYELK